MSQHPAAIGIELMNEPPFATQVPFETGALFDLFRECYDVVRAITPELDVGVADSGQVAKYADDRHVPSRIRDWLRHNATHIMYTFHWYHGFPHPPYPDALASATSLAKLWDAVPVMTEFTLAGNYSSLADEAGVAWTYYEYSSYCNVPDRSHGPALHCQRDLCLRRLHHVGPAWSAATVSLSGVGCRQNSHHASCTSPGVHK